MTLRVSCTAIETFRLFEEPEQEWLTYKALVQSLLGQSPTNDKMRLGTAFGRVLENPARYRVAGGYIYDEEFFFDDDMMNAAFEHMDYQHGVFEAKAEKSYGRITVVSKADQCVGTILKEHKATTGYADFDKWANSYQWRFMVDAFEPSQVTYHIFRIGEKKKTKENRDNLYLDLRLKGVDTFNLFPYPAVHLDCQDLVGRFADFIERHNLVHYFEGRAREASAIGDYAVSNRK